MEKLEDYARRRRRKAWAMRMMVTTVAQMSEA